MCVDALFEGNVYERSTNCKSFVSVGCVSFVGNMGTLISMEYHHFGALLYRYAAMMAKTTFGIHVASIGDRLPLTVKVDEME